MSQADSLQKHFDVIVIGTGLRESILAAALSKSGRHVLHVDEHPYYGDSQATLSLNELVQWSQSYRDEQCPDLHLSFPASGQAALPPELLKNSREYNISLCPVLVSAISPFVDIMVRSGVAKYSGFQLLEAVAMFENSQLKRTATTKEDIFNDDTLSLSDKRKLTKFFMFASGNFEEASIVEGNDNIPFQDFLTLHFALTGKLRDMIVYSAALSSVQSDCTIDALVRIRKYVKATRRYGKSPFLLGQYGGIGELVQGFCRLCAVFGGTYMLGQRISNVTRSTSVSAASIELNGQEVYTADCLIMTRKTLVKRSNAIHRAIIVLSEPVKIESAGLSQGAVEHDDEGPIPISPIPIDAQSALFVFPPHTLENEHPKLPVIVCMAGEGTFSAPRGQYLLYLSCIADGQGSTAFQIFEPCLNALLRSNGSTDINAVQLASLYYTETMAADLMVDQKGIAEQLDFGQTHHAPANLAEVCDIATHQAATLFERLTGEKDLFEMPHETLYPDEDD